MIRSLAGAALGQAIPSTSAEVDDMHRDAVVGSFRMALLEPLELLVQAREASEVELN